MEIKTETRKVVEPLIYDLGAPGRNVSTLMPNSDVPESPLPENLLRADLDLAEVSEIDVVRHFVKLSQLNYAIDKGFYPLGSCTMKYNPKIDETLPVCQGLLCYIQCKTRTRHRVPWHSCTRCKRGYQRSRDLRRAAFNLPPERKVNLPGFS